MIVVTTHLCRRAELNDWHVAAASGSPFEFIADHLQCQRTKRRTNTRSMVRQVSRPTGLITSAQIARLAGRAASSVPHLKALEQVRPNRLFALMGVVVVSFLTVAQILSDPKQPGSLTGWLVFRKRNQKLKERGQALARRLLIDGSNTE
ncbi:hypothetical protein [Bradyrhizobium sp. CCBAU 53415]|uniref:hypothetical protein n=1 Tax=Bradyrhizobium sp. CCBAU 53415 TaxID=1325119 RepID=UPI0023068282|nr:hypothetical protein [Bradyrhizobium sp. CCBAU 53415]